MPVEYYWLPAIVLVKQQKTTQRVEQIKQNETKNIPVLFCIYMYEKRNDPWNET